MAERMVQQGVGQARDLVVVYYLAAELDSKLKQAAPGALILNDTRANTAEYRVVGGGGIAPIRDLAARTGREQGCIIRSITLVGYSAGCQALRAQLQRGAGDLVDGLVPVDGTHASFPAPSELMEIKPWRDFADQARAKRKVMTATHTMLTYTEQLPKPFMCTWHVLQRVTGWPLAEQGEDGVPVPTEEGFLAVWSYADADAAGHRYQGREALPAALEATLKLVRTKPAAVVDAPPTTERSAQPAVEWAGDTLGQRAVAWAEAQMKAGKCEVPKGSNAGPFVAECLEPCVRNGKPLGLRAGNWCAAFACAAEANARLSGDPPPVHEYRASGFELEQDAKAAGVWRAAEQARSGAFEPEVGDIVTFKRGAESWQRHVVRFMRWLDRARGKYETIGGNEADGIRITVHDLAEPQLSGFIELPGAKVETAAGGAFRAAQLMALSDSVMAGGGEDIAAIMARLDADRDGEDA